MDEFTGEFCYIFKDKIIPIFYNLFWRTDAKAILPNSYYEAKITLILKAEKTLQA